MIEFLLKRDNGDLFDIKRADFSKILHPITYPSAEIEGWGDYRICVMNCDISFSYEHVGIQVIFECHSFSFENALKIVEEILVNIENITGDTGYITPL